MYWFYCIICIVVFQECSKLECKYIKYLYVNAKPMNKSLICLHLSIYRNGWSVSQLPNAHNSASTTAKMWCSICRQLSKLPIAAMPARLPRQISKLPKTNPTANTSSTMSSWHTWLVEPNTVIIHSDEAYFNISFSLETNFLRILSYLTRTSENTLCLRDKNSPSKMNFDCKMRNVQLWSRT